LLKRRSPFSLLIPRQQQQQLELLLGVNLKKMINTFTKLEIKETCKTSHKKRKEKK
jgi:hypothetical protein